LFTNSGVEIISEYVKGISKVIYRNDINSFKADDIVGDIEFSEVSLLQRGSVLNSNLAYDIELEVNGVKGEWLLDSGAMNFTIGNIMFKRLIAMITVFTLLILLINGLMLLYVNIPLWVSLVSLILFMMYFFYDSIIRVIK
jgi:hypothetical protein